MYLTYASLTDLLRYCTFLKLHIANKSLLFIYLLISAGLGWWFGQHITELVTELRTSLKHESNAEINTVNEKINNIESKLRKIEEVEKNAAENSEELKRQKEKIECHSNELERHSNELEHLNEKLKTEDHDKQKENYSEFAVKKVPYGLRSLPRDMVERPSEVNEILGLLIPSNSKVGVVGNRSSDVFGIRGMGGLGKTVLALAVASAASDSRQVIWLDIGETPDCLALINILIKVIGGAVSFSDIHAAQAWIKANTSDKDCLVVLDDVWSVDDVAVFDHLSGKCQLLITTRDAKVVRGSKGFVYELQFMAADKSRALLYQSAGVEPDELSTFSPEMHQIVEELLKQCRGLPLALSLVGSNLIDTRLQQDWQDVLGYFQKAGLEQLHSQFPAVMYPYDNILAAIDASFQRLEKNEREKFLDFGIFPEDTNIASDILELFWSSKEAGRASYSPQEARYTDVNTQLETLKNALHSTLDLHAPVKVDQTHLSHVK
ncbi:WD repeat [Paramuricea clavata]|uniref:WD repeat n=1 Tax=Paramuricea clavata TaxID=317549 RepID=A0A6S7GK33_PARCT|nr:WD repeat [Paramuricea clavata]